MQKQTAAIPTTSLPMPTERGNGSQITIGKTVYTVKVHFGKIALEDILRQRILRESTHEAE